MAHAGSKRPWEEVDDPEELRDMLDDQQEKLQRVQKELATLKHQLKAKDQEGGGAPAAGGIAPGVQAEQARRSIKTTLNSQMVYKPSIKHGKGRLSAELPNMPLAAVMALLGDHAASASDTKKTVTVTVDAHEVSDVLGGSISKSLRYGSMLNVMAPGLKFVYSKETMVLKVSGFYHMGW